jgi:hypothetical protein
MGSRNQIGTDGSNSRTGVLHLCVSLVHLDFRWLRDFFVLLLMILLLSNKKRRNPGKKYHVRTMIHSSVSELRPKND